MKEIDLPITQTVSLSFKADTLNLDGAKDCGDGRLLVPLGSLIDGKISKTIEIARKNGGKILYATTSIEQQLESILLQYFMGPFKVHDDKRVMFETEILQSSALSYSAKKKLVSTVINSSNLITGKKKNKIQRQLKDIMDWRNAFAHGKIQHDNIKGCFVNYYSGSPLKLYLTDSFWDEVISCYTECNESLKEVYEKIDTP